MADKCKNCGAKIIKFPIWKGQDKGEPFSWDKLMLINLFKMDFYSIILVIVIIAMVIGYKSDIKQCDQVIHDPCTFCEKSNCCQVDWARINPSTIIDTNNLPDYKFNITKI